MPVETIPDTFDMRLTPNKPLVGISFAYLKGSIGRLDRVINEQQSHHELRHAITQLRSALSAFDRAVEHTHNPNEHVRRMIELSPQLKSRAAALLAETAEYLSDTEQLLH